METPFYTEAELDEMIAKARLFLAVRARWKYALSIHHDDVTAPSFTPPDVRRYLTDRRYAVRNSALRVLGVEIEDAQSAYEKASERLGMERR